VPTSTGPLARPEAGRSRLSSLRGHPLAEIFLSALVVTSLAVIDLSAGPTVVLAGLMAVGPCLTAISGTPRSVIAVGAYSVGLLALVSGPDHLWWARQQLFLVIALVVVTAISVAATVRRQHHDEELHAAQEEAARVRAVSEATGEYLSRVSHELRTPLNAVLGFTQILQLGQLTADQRESTDQVERAGRHLLALVNDVLDVTAIESQRLTLSLEAVLVNDVIQEAMELTTAQARVSRISVESDLQRTTDWHVSGDLRRLRQILVNLVSNGIKFNRPAGTVRISAERDGAGNISILVSDNGPGIAVRDRARLFLPFERLGATTPDIEGSGLGLTLSRGLAEAMGGSLSLMAHDAAGATFVVTLTEVTPPVATIAPLADPAARPPTLEQTGSALVLYIEDNPSNVRLVEMILQHRQAWRLTHAATGLAGLELALMAPFDLILLDQNLPDLEGLEVLRRLRARPERADVPVVIVSADAAPGHLKRALTAGATDYLVKPFTIEAFLAVMDAHAPPVTTSA
jgi:signal transduction histidine kinase/ActR/RegA family two-component response regulator